MSDWFIEPCGLGSERFDVCKPSPENTLCDRFTAERGPFIVIASDMLHEDAQAFLGLHVRDRARHEDLLRLIGEQSWVLLNYAVVTELAGGCASQIAKGCALVTIDIRETLLAHAQRFEPMP